MSDVTAHPPIESPAGPSSLRHRLRARLSGIPWGVWLLMAIIGYNLVGSVVGMFDTSEWDDGTGARALGLPVLWWLILVGSTSFYSVNLLGLYHRHPLLRQLWVVLTTLVIVVSIFRSAQMIARQAFPSDLSGWDYVPTVIAVVVLLGLRTPATRRWFGLECPTCGSLQVVAGNLFYSRIRCKACKHRWHRRDVRAINPAVFD